ncbi:integrase, catalytic region, zinc finger, CCHC-type containing protein [Tanacetum coccineum]
MSQKRSFAEKVESEKQDPNELKVEAPALFIMSEKDYVFKFPRMEEYLKSGEIKNYVPNLEIIYLPEEETLMPKEESRSKMLLKQSDLMVLEKKVNIKPINYVVLNQLSKDFAKRFVPQQELSIGQAFWFPMSNPSTNSSDASPVKVDVPSELPKVSLVNASLKKHKFHLAQFNFVVKKRTTSDALTEGEWGFEHTKATFINEIIPFLKSLKDIFNVFDKDLLNEITEVQTIFDQMDAVVQQCSVDKRCLEIKMKQVLNENDRLLNQIISQDIVNIVVNSSVDINDSVNAKSMEMCNKCLELEAELIKQHNMVSNATTIAPRMYKLDLVILAPRDKNNRETHIYYLKHTMEQAAILREIVKQAKLLNPLDSASYTACKYVKLIQEFLGYVRDTCPNIHKPSKKLVAVTPINKKKTVRFAEPVASSSNIPKVINRPLLSSTGVKPSTSASRSKPPGYTKNDRIS